MDKLFPLQVPPEAARAQSVVDPANAGTDYAEMRREFPVLPTSVFETDNLKAVYKRFDIDLSVATENQEFNIRGNVLSFIDSTNTSDRLRIRYDSVQNDEVPFKPGQTIDGMYYDTLYISWDATAGATATIFTAYDPRNAQRSTVG